MVYIQGTWDKNGGTKITLLLMHKIHHIRICQLLLIAGSCCWFLDLMCYVYYIHPVSGKLYSKQMAIHINQISKQVYTDYYHIIAHQVVVNNQTTTAAYGIVSAFGSC